MTTIFLSPLETALEQLRRERHEHAAVRAREYGHIQTELALERRVKELETHLAAANDELAWREEQVSEMQRLLDCVPSELWPPLATDRGAA